MGLFCCVSTTGTAGGLRTRVIFYHGNGGVLVFWVDLYICYFCYHIILRCLVMMVCACVGLATGCTREFGVGLSLIIPYCGRRKGIRGFCRRMGGTFANGIRSCRFIFIGSKDGSGACPLLGGLCRRRERSRVRILSFDHGFNGRTTVCTKLGGIGNSIIYLVSTSLRREPRIILRVLSIVGSSRSVSYMATCRRRHGRGGVVDNVGSTFCGLVGGITSIPFIGNTSSFHLVGEGVISTIVRVDRCREFSGNVFDFINFGAGCVPCAIYRERDNRSG